jgi:hypothetical protein
MFTNQRLRKDFATSILQAKDNLHSLKIHKRNLVRECEDFVGQYSSVVPSQKTIDFITLAENTPTTPVEASETETILEII